MVDLSVARLVALADEIAVHAKNGTYWSKDRYDVERYARILALATDILGGILQHDPADVARWYTDEPGTLTAKVGASVAALPISPGYDDPIRDAFAAYRSGNITAFFDT